MAAFRALGRDRGGVGRASHAAPYARATASRVIPYAPRLEWERRPGVEHIVLRARRLLQGGEYTPRSGTARRLTREELDDGSRLAHDLVGEGVTALQGRCAQQ